MKTSDSLSSAIAILKDSDARLKLTLAAGRKSADLCASAIASQRRALRSVERTEIVGSLVFLVLLSLSTFLFLSF